MKKIKQVFPSRNYITIDSFGDVEVVFNPVGDGFEGDDKLLFRKGRWAFRVNDFLAGKTMPDGTKEGMGRKVYSLNLVYNEEDGEPIVNTTYVDPTSVIPLDGSLVEVVGSEKLAQEMTVQTLAKEETVQTLAKEGTVQTLAKEETVLALFSEVSKITKSREFMHKLLLHKDYPHSDGYYILPKGSMIKDNNATGGIEYLCLTDCCVLVSLDWYNFFGHFCKRSGSINNPVIEEISGFFYERKNYIKFYF